MIDQNKTFTRFLLGIFIFLLLFNITIQTFVFSEVGGVAQAIKGQETLISEQELTCPQPEVIQPQIIEEIHFTERVDDYARFITTIGPLLREYPEMIQFMMLYQMTTNANLLVLPGDKLEALIPLSER